MRYGIIPFTYFGGLGKASGSTHLRVNGLIKKSSEFEVWRHGHTYDGMIFQKVYWTEMAECFKGPKILDICDPDWINNGFDLVEFGEKMDAITCSSEQLAALVVKYFPNKIVEHIPDRLCFDDFPNPRNPHYGKAKTIAWFGFIHNAQKVLPPLFPLLKKLNLNFLIIADRPFEYSADIKDLKYQFIPYDQFTVYNYLKTADIVLNPKSDLASFKYKSNNKSIIAWHLGIAVAETIDELNFLMKPENRNQQIYENQRYILEHYNVRDSALEFLKIFGRIGKCQI